ncbi:GAF domain-containing protein [Solirubrobacter phytolaccae]|uniref:GAF domain-containing protein n=1 Tax=Solirubrobacter phytolaccae TaxID=1404360 RepID=A0A9X3NDI8_9ACTN|nr:GAF domain-containing protein [Solirubrobacter phytolaccae]MDA0183219.1 GAF domain-containing protein [Solirubrobacter phytolaccae]
MESHTVPQQPTVSIDALETFVELLARVDADPATDDFYSRLCEATCRLADMDRAVIFRYDGARRRVRAAGAYGIDLDVFADAQVNVETVRVARDSLVEDRVIEISSSLAEDVPEEYRSLITASNTLVCTPMAAAGRWLGVILSDRKPDRPPLSDSERYVLWTLGKTAALAAFARQATNKQAQARQLSERMDLAREVHESVIQRLFGIQLVFSSQAELSPAARQRIAAELQAALHDLRRALQRPLARQAPETNTTVLEEVERLRREHRDLRLVLTPGSEAVEIPKPIEPLAQSVLAEAVRNAHKHAKPSKIEVSLAIKDADTLVLDVVNDGIRGRARHSGMGLKLAALEALQFGGIVEFGERDPGWWRVRLAVPLDRS